MEIEKPEISNEFLNKVNVLARAKIMLPADKLRLLKDLHRVTCECDFLPDGSLDYRVGDQTATQLHFKIEGGSVIIIEYKAGDWLQRLDIAHLFANVLMMEVDVGLSRTVSNLWDKMQSSQNHIEKVEYAKKVAQLTPFEASAWGVLSQTLNSAGLYKDAARAGTIALNLEPYNAQWHMSLSIIYYTAFINSKCAVSLGCTSGYARQLAEKHCREALRLSDEKDTRLNKAAEEVMSGLRGDFDRFREFAIACKLCELDPLSDVTDDIVASITETCDKTKTKELSSAQDLSEEQTLELVAAWWLIFARQYSQKCVERWAKKCEHIQNYNIMNKVWSEAFEPLWLAGCEVAIGIRLKETVDTVIQNYLKSGKLNEDNRKSVEAWLEEYCKHLGEIASIVIAKFRVLQSQSIEATLRELPKFDQASLLGKLKPLIYDN